MIPYPRHPFFTALPRREARSSGAHRDTVFSWDKRPPPNSEPHPPTPKIYPVWSCLSVLFGKYREMAEPPPLQISDSVKRHLRERHLSVLNLKFDFISDGGRTREEQIALSLKRHLFLHGGREPKAIWICFFAGAPTIGNKIEF